MVAQVNMLKALLVLPYILSPNKASRRERPCINAQNVCAFHQS